MPKNISKLILEIEAAGLPVVGATPELIYYSRELTEEEKNIEKQIVDAHSPEVYSLEPKVQIIIANGVHEANVICSVSPAVDGQDTLTVNGVSQVIELENGMAEIVFSSTTPGTTIKLEYHGLYAVILAE